MKYILTTPQTIGDFQNAITIDRLEIQSFSLTLDPQKPVLSVVLVHKASGWQHVVTYTDSTAVQFWASTYATQFDLLCRALLGKLVADSKLPPGTIQ